MQFLNCFLAKCKWVNINYLSLYACQFSLHQFSQLLRKFYWYRICFLLCHLEWTIFTISYCSSRGDHWLENCVYKKSHCSHQSWWDRDRRTVWMKGLLQHFVLISSSIWHIHPIWRTPWCFFSGMFWELLWMVTSLYLPQLPE